MPCIMAGNAILVLGVGLVTKKCKGNGGLIAGMAAGSVIKALFMGIVISLILIPNLLPAPMEAKMAVFQTTFKVAVGGECLPGAAVHVKYYSVAVAHGDGAVYVVCPL